MGGPKISLRQAVLIDHNVVMGEKFRGERELKTS